MKMKLKDFNKNIQKGIRKALKSNGLNGHMVNLHGMAGSPEVVIEIKATGDMIRVNVEEI